MRIPTIRGIIDRRILVNFRVDAEAIRKLLPEPFQPQLFQGHAIAGICLIRLKHVRPKFLPAFIGSASENAAHRIAVQWTGDDHAGLKTGVYIPRRDTSSRMNALAGGRIFPGLHHHARFDIEESEARYQVAMHSMDGSAHLSVDATVAKNLPENSLFNSTEQVSEFFEQGSLGYSPKTNDPNSDFDGLELRTFNWQVTPLNVTKVESSFFDDTSTFPVGSVEFDDALLMRGIDHEWHSRDSICAGAC